MPLSLPHAVFTPENCLAVGGQVYTKGNLAQSIDGLRVQERASSISNEDLDELVYNTLAKILKECDSILDSVEKAQLLNSYSTRQLVSIHPNSGVNSSTFTSVATPSTLL